MADRLPSILKESKLATLGESGLVPTMKMECLRKKPKGNDLMARGKVVKKVRFGPENEIFFFDATSAVKCDILELDDRNVRAGLIIRQLRNRKVVVGKSELDLVASNKNVKGSSYKMARNQVTEENVPAVGDDVVEKFSGTFGMVTRSRARGGFEKVPQLKEPSKGVGRNVLVQKSSEAVLGLRKTRQEIDKNDGSEMLSGNLRKVASGKRSTRSQAKKTEGACAAESKHEEETVQTEDNSNRPRENACRKGSTVPNKSKKQSRNSNLEGALDLEAIADSSKVLEVVKNVAIPRGPSRGTRRNVLILNSTILADVGLDTQQNVGLKGPCMCKSVPRRSKRNVQNCAANRSAPDKVLLQKELQVVKGQDCNITNVTRRRGNSVNGSMKTIIKPAGKASAIECGTEEEHVQVQIHSKGLVRHSSRQKSVASHKSKVEKHVPHEKAENGKRSRKDVSELEAFAVPIKEVKMVKNVCGPTGPSRKTRHKTVKLKSSISANELLEGHQTARPKDVKMTKNLRKPSRIASSTISSITSSEVDGTAVDVGKVREQKRRQNPVLDEDASMSECKPLTKRTLKRSARNVSKMDFVEPAEPTSEGVRKKHYGRSIMPITEQKALYPQKLSAPEDGRLAVEDSPFHEDYAVSKETDHTSLCKESDIKQCADVAKENLEKAQEVELIKSDTKVVAPEVNAAAGTSLMVSVPEESEVSGHRAVETMIKQAECAKGVDNLKVDESNILDKISDTKATIVLAQVSGNHLVRYEDKEEHEGSTQNERTVAGRGAQTMATEVKDLPEKAGNVETSVPGSPMIAENTCGYELSQINETTGGLSVVIAADVEHQREGSSEVMGFVPHFDDVNFGDLENYKENVSDLERSASVMSCDLVATNSRVADMIENSNDITSDAEREDNVNAILEVTGSDSYDHLQEAKLCIADDSDQCDLFHRAILKTRIAAEDAAEVAVDGNNGCGIIDADTKWTVRLPIFSPTIMDEKRQDDKINEGGIVADTSFSKSDMDPVFTNCEIQMDKSYVYEELVKIEPAATSRGFIADLGGYKSEYAFDDSTNTENYFEIIFLNCTGSGGNSTGQIQTEATVDMQEVENAGNIEPITPKELCTACENQAKTSNKTTVSKLHQLLSSANGWKENFCKEMNESIMQMEDFSNDAGRKDMVDEDLGAISDLALPFQDESIATRVKCKPVDDFIPEHNARDSLDFIKNQPDRDNI